MLLEARLMLCEVSQPSEKATIKGLLINFGGRHKILKIRSSYDAHLDNRYVHALSSDLHFQSIQGFLISYFPKHIKGD